MWTLIAAFCATPAQAQDGEFSFSLLGGGYFVHSDDLFGDAVALAPRIGYWYRPELGVEVDLPFLFGGRTRPGDPREAWGGMLPNVGIVGRLWSDKPVSLLLGASVGASLRQISPADPDVTGNLDADFALLAGPGLLVSVSDDVHLRAEWRGILNVGAYDGRPDLGSRDASLGNGMLLAGLTYLPSGPPDGDGDGVPDEDDLCDNQAEDLDGFEDLDGCPELDNDQDGIADDLDRCADATEDLDGFEDDDGCPDVDNDEDGVLDAEDRCPIAAGIADLRGCPDGDGDGVADIDDECADETGGARAFGCPDRDGDRVPDHRDACPDEATREGVDARRDDGCPRTFYIAQDAIVILEQVRFLSGSATIQRRSHALLDGVAGVLKGNPGVKRVRIEGHTDNSGSEDTNLRLSQLRAESVKAYLESQGVEAERLVAQGFGESQPIADNGTKAGRDQNRRVEFDIVEQDLSPVQVTEGEATAPTP